MFATASLLKILGQISPSLLGLVCTYVCFQFVKKHKIFLTLFSQIIFLQLRSSSEVKILDFLLKLITREEKSNSLNIADLSLISIVMDEA